MKKQYFGNCVNNPFGSINKLCEIIDNAEEVSQNTFLEHCEVGLEMLSRMETYPDDYSYYRYKDIFFFRESATEYFYK